MRTRDLTSTRNTFRAAVVLTAVLGAASPVTAQQFDAREYVGRAVSIIRERALTADAVDWDAVTAEAHRLAEGARQPVDAYDAVAFVISELRDNHSNFRPAPAAAATYFERLRERLGQGGARPGVDTLFSRRRMSATDLATAGAPVRHVVVPGFSGSEEAAATYVTTLHGALVAAPTPCGYIIDLRGNGGGNMWPMLAGLAPLLPDGDLGAFVYRSDTTAIFHRRGVVGTRAAGNEHVLSAAPDTAAPFRIREPALAVLIDSGTLSSGEITAIMLKAVPGARLFGTRTFGVATGVQAFPLPDGATIMLTVADVADRSMRTYRSGVEPDEHVPNTSAEAAHDALLAAAHAWLPEQRGGCS